MDKLEPSIIVKAKRGRKSKKELMESLNIKQPSPTKKTDKQNINLNVIETQEPIQSSNENIFDSILNNNNPIDNEHIDLNENIDLNKNNSANQVVIISNPNDKQTPAIKKRGRKPKGGKIIQQIITDETQKEEKPNVILHLKCCLKDLNNASKNNCVIESYNFQSKNDLTYELINNGNNELENISSNINHNLNNEYGTDDDDDESVCKDATKETWKKLKQLEHNLHINNVNKKSACFWDTCDFDNPPVYIPKHTINKTTEVYGCFCSPECAVAYLMKEPIDSSTKFERYHNLNHIYAKVYDYKKNIKPAPDALYMLDKFYGNLSIQEYRALLRNERLFLIVDKPLTRVMPELHEDNDEFILNNKIIPSNNYNIKSRLQKKKQNKNSIVNEQFGLVALE
jgi:hypothetical protein